MSTLRCKVGDLVFVKKGRQLPENNGRYGTIISRDVSGRHDWVVQPQRTFAGFLTNHKVVDDDRPTAFYDSSLQPIRPQSNDAVDQMVQRVGPAPTTPAPAGTYALLAVFPGEEPAFYDADLRPMSDLEILQGVSHG